jgi:hypothetical protein
VGRTKRKRRMRRKTKIGLVSSVMVFAEEADLEMC